jgi:hypothetical protein
MPMLAMVLIHIHHLQIALITNISARTAIEVRVLRMAQILEALPLASIDKVTFFKRDELTTDLICCEVVIGDQFWTFHEKMTIWDGLITHLKGLPGFHEEWFVAVSQPAFAPCETVAFQR